MRETLRLTPSAPNRSCAPYEDIELIGGDGDPNNPANKKYLVKKDTLLTIHADLMMKDPLVWGEDAEVFRPERMMGGAFEKLPVRIIHCLPFVHILTVSKKYQAWQPFGYGLRACIVSWYFDYSCQRFIHLRVPLFREGPSPGRRRNSSLPLCSTSSTFSSQTRDTLCS